MSSRVWNLCQSLLPREAKRADLFLVRVAIIGAVLLITAMWRLGASPRSGTVWASSVVARHGMQMLFIIQALAGLAVATRLAGDAVGDRKSGFLELLSLSGCTSSQWLGTRLLTVLPAVATTWTIPIPFFFLAFSFGGLDLQTIAIAEGLLLCQLMMLIAVGFVMAHGAAARSALRSLPSLVVALEVGQSVPGMLVTFAASVGWGIPAWVLDTSSFISRATTRRCVLAALQGGLTGPQLAAGCLIPLAIAGVALWHWMRELYSEPSEEPSSLAHASGRLLRRLLGKPRSNAFEENEVAAPAFSATPPPAVSPSAPAVPSAAVAKALAKAPTSEPQPAVMKPVTRLSRRSWDDALAWQAYEVFNRGEKGTVERSLLYGTIGVLTIPFILLAGRPWAEFGMVGLLLSCIVSLFRGMSRAGECLQQEIKESTLSTLMLTPHEPAELHDGWSRGALRLLRPELGLLAVAFLLTLWRDPETLAPSAASVGLGLLAIGPFLTLSPLLPYTFSGIGTGLLVFAAAGVIATTGMVAGIYIHPWAAPLVLAPLVYGWNRLCRSLVGAWLMNKIRALT